MIFPTVGLIRKLNIRPSKKFGQNFLIDRNTASKAVACARIGPHDTVVEIGPGLGSLTFFIRDQCREACCFELDRDVFRALSKTMAPHGTVTVSNRDIMQVSLSDCAGAGGRIILTGSIPYNLTTPILLKFFRDSAVIKRAVFIMQSEVARRLCASPGSRDYGILSVYCRAYVTTKLHMTIPPECFYPRPGVTSSVLELEPLQTRTWNGSGEDFFRQVVRALFAQRRKTIYNNLKAYLGSSRTRLDTLKDDAARAGIDTGRRAETLSVSEFGLLADLVKKHAGGTLQ